MIRLLILIFALNTLLPSVGFSAMLSSNADRIMTQSVSHNMVMSPSDTITKCSMMEGCDDMSNALCQVHCSTGCVQIPVLATVSLLTPFTLSSREPTTVFAHFYSRSISPKLRPPIV